MATNGLDASLYRDWIDKEIVITPFLQKMLSEFVIGTPAYGLSQKGRELYTYYQYRTITEYDALYDDLLDGIDFKSFEKYEDLRNAILSHSIMNFSNILPTIDCEHIFIYTGNVSDSELFKAYFKSSNTTKGKKKEEIKQEAALRKKTVAIDKVFYHLRNGLAHGCYTMSRINGEECIIIQDESKDQFISARIVMLTKSLDRWITYLNTRAKTINTLMTEVSREELPVEIATQNQEENKQ